MAERYSLPIGLSDHTLTNYASLAAVTLGATVIEKHFTFSRKMYGSDAKHSLEPAEMVDLVQGIRAIEIMKSSEINKAQVDRFQDMKDIFEKSLVAEDDIPAGAILTRELIGIKKPGTGISAARMNEFLGRKLCRDVKAGNMFSEKDFCNDQGK